MVCSPIRVSRSRQFADVRSAPARPSALDQAEVVVERDRLDPAAAQELRRLGQHR
jgi:hypothetical protein